MKEHDKIIKAKDYIDKLANGIDPISNKPAHADDVINQVEITRCLFFVSDLLRQMLESDDDAVSASGLRSRKHFYITKEQILKLKPDNETHTVSEISNKINEATLENCTRKMQASWINDWLLSIGMLQIIEGEKRVTAQGTEIGIKSHMRNNIQRGNYYINLYNAYAQEFIFNNIEAIVNYHYSKASSK